MNGKVPQIQTLQKKINQTPKKRNGDFIFNHSSIQLMVGWSRVEFDYHDVIYFFFFSLSLSTTHAPSHRRTCEGFSTGHGFFFWRNLFFVKKRKIFLLRSAWQSVVEESMNSSVRRRIAAKFLCKSIEF
ncbi:hypothetical protein CDAR_475391 [Caerostris darwini]|uniref:Uncharacterized protein n=1 Tax=Caerostris darwini TaxID=1538125 RepID=A0AAV4PF46_9ARAC|nr:hypothetical protein CDAR_475391 [Caerostris darwini]